MSSDVADECEAIRKRMEEYVPGHGFTKISILLTGMMGHGKSSLINTCCCVTRNERYYNEAGSGDSVAPITLEAREYELKGSVCIVDNRGLNKLNVNEQIEIASQYSRLTGLGEVEWNRALDDVFRLLIDKVKNPPTEFYVPVFVYSVPCPFPEQLYKEIEPFLREVHIITGIFPIIVLTRSEHISMTVRTREKDFKRLGAKIVIPIENYTTENPDRNDTTDKTVATFLKTCLDETHKAISRKRSCNEDEFFINAIRQIKEKVAHEIRQRDQVINEKNKQIQLLEREVIMLRERCILM